MRSTSKFDKNGKELFEGDKVIMAWGWMLYKGQKLTKYELHTIKYHVDHARFILGMAFNNWKGEELEKYDPEEVAHIPEDTPFYVDHNAQIVELRGWHYTNMTEEEYKKFEYEQFVKPFLQ